MALPDERITAVFTPDSRLEMTPEMLGATRTRMEGLVGQGIDIGTEALGDARPSAISYALAKEVMFRCFTDANGVAKVHLFNQIQAITRRWIDEGYLVCLGGTEKVMVLYQEMKERAVELIYAACLPPAPTASEVLAVLDPYNPRGSTSHVNFSTAKPLYRTDPARCHVNYVVEDSDWEAEFARVAEAHPRVRAYVKNQGLQFEVPYRIGAQHRRYWPDFIVRLDDGQADPLNLVVEIKGLRGTEAQVKAETMRKLWVPGVNNLGTFGRWAFAEFTEVFRIEAAFMRLIDAALNAEPATENA